MALLIWGVLQEDRFELGILDVLQGGRFALRIWCVLQEGRFELRLWGVSQEGRFELGIWSGPANIVHFFLKIMIFEELFKNDLDKVGENAEAPYYKSLGACGTRNALLSGFMVGGMLKSRIGDVLNPGKSSTFPFRFWNTK